MVNLIVAHGKNGFAI